MMPLLTLLRLRGTTPTAATRVTRRWRQKITYSRNTPRGSRPGRVRWQNNIGTAVGARRSAAMYLAGFLAADRMTTFDHTARLSIGGSRSIVTGRKGEDAMAFADKINGNMQQQGDVT